MLATVTYLEYLGMRLYCYATYLYDVRNWAYRAPKQVENAESSHDIIDHVTIVPYAW